MEAFPAITLVTDDPVLQAAIPAQLRHALGISCEVVGSGENFNATPPALALLDCATMDMGRLPGLRRNHPLMALIGIGTAAQAEAFEALPLSAFVRRPVSMPVLLRHIERLGYERALHAGQQQLAFPLGAIFHPADKTILLSGGESIELTDKESAILLCLYHHRHGWLPRASLLEQVWGYSDAITTHTLETHLYRLRNKLRDAFNAQELIITRNGGYRLAL